MSHSPQDVHKKILGRHGEKLVLQYLKERGCQIIKRNYRTPFGEADLIVQDGEETAFVEVKTRLTQSYGTPREAVGEQKRQRYYQIARYYWSHTGQEPNARFDVAEVYGDGKIEYYENAF